MQTKKDNMIMRAKRRITVLTRCKKTNMVVTKMLTNTLQKQLQITLTQSHSLVGLAGLRVRIPRKGNMVIIVGKSHKIGRIMTFQLHHTPCSPLLGVSNTAADTLTTRKLNKLINGVGLIADIHMCLSIIGPIIKDFQRPLAIILDTKLNSINGMITTHPIEPTTRSPEKKKTTKSW